MSRAIKKKSGLYAYLDSMHVLNKGDDAIRLAKKDYYRTYKAEWAKQHRNTTKQFTIAFTPSKVEEIAIAARKCGMSKSRYIKESCLAYMDKRYLPIDPVSLAAIRQLLAFNYNALLKIDEKLLPYDIGRMLKQQMADLEHKVLIEMYHPKEI